MSLKLLDPTLDVVFKLLLIRNPILLRDMIEAVVKLPAPIEDLEVLNPEIPEDAPGDKRVVLDIRVRLQGGHQIDLEMQSTVPPGTRARFLYYWAKGFANLIARGDDYTLLRPCISILWFKVPLLPTAQFHSTFVAADLNSREILSPELEIHVLEVPKLHLAPTDRQAKLDRWARFLRASTVEELEELANEDATMNTAKKALEELSMDPEARRIASDRETAVLMHQHLLAASREAGRDEGRVEGEAKGRAEGEAKGRDEGRVEGRNEGLHAAIESMCGAFGIALSAERRRYLAALDVDQLNRVVQALATERSWPERL